MSRRIDIALTLDVEFNKPSLIAETGSLYSGLEMMSEVIDIYDAQGVPGTWFIAHDVDPDNQIARRHPGLVDRMGRNGEIGCHFHFHENRKARTDEPFQRRGIGEATRYLRAGGHPITSFRGGNCYLDATVLRILEELGFTVDSSVVPGMKEISPEGLVTDHRARRSCEPYHPLAGEPWKAGGDGILEIPMMAYTYLDLRTPVLSVLINRVLGINNLVLSSPRHAASLIDTIARDFKAGHLVVVMSAHPYDFLPGGGPDRKLENADRFISIMRDRPGVTFSTLASIRDRWAPDHAARSHVHGMIDVTSSDLRRIRNGVRRFMGSARALLGGSIP